MINEQRQLGLILKHKMLCLSIFVTSRILVALFLHGMHFHF